MANFLKVLLLFIFIILQGCGSSSSSTNKDYQTNSTPKEQTSDSTSSNNLDTNNTDTNTTKNDLPPKEPIKPKAVDDNVTIMQDEFITIDVLANDNSNNENPLIIKSITTPKNGKAKIKDNKIDYTPNSGYIGEDSFLYTIQNSDGLTSSAIVSIKILEEPKDEIFAKNDNAIVDEDSEVLIDALSNDSKNLTLVSITNPKYGSAKIENSKILYIPNSNYNGKDSFSYIVEDSNSNSARADVFVTINPVNDAPIAKADISPTNAKEGQEITFDASLSSDIDGDTLTYKWLENNELLSTSKIFKKSDFSVGEHTIILTVSDGALSSSVTSKIVINEDKNEPSKLKKSGQTTTYLDYDDGYYQAGLEFNYNRDDSKEIVIDYVTNLEWQDSSDIKNSTKNWNDALDYCNNLELGGYSNWRLPTAKELYSLIDFSKSNSAYSSAFINYSTSGYYWSSTISAKDSSKAWIVYFDDGRFYSIDKNNALNFRCVREHN